MKRVSGDILGAPLGSALRRSLASGLELRKVWKDALGRQLSGVLRPGVLDEQGCLEVLVENSAWLMEARFLEPRILASLSRALPGLGIRKVKLALAASEEPPERAAPRTRLRPRREIGDEERRRIRGLVASIRDDEVREGLGRLLEKAASRGDPAEQEEADDD